MADRRLARCPACRGPLGECTTLDDPRVMPLAAGQIGICVWCTAYLYVDGDGVARILPALALTALAHDMPEKIGDLMAARRVIQRFGGPRRN